MDGPACGPRPLTPPLHLLRGQRAALPVAAAQCLALVQPVPQQARGQRGQAPALWRRAMGVGRQPAARVVAAQVQHARHSQSKVALHLERIPMRAAAHFERRRRSQQRAQARRQAGHRHVQ